MINPTQLATLLIVAMVSAGALCVGIDRAAAAPASGDAIGAPPNPGPAARAKVGSGNSSAVFTEAAASVKPLSSTRSSPAIPVAAPRGRAYVFRGALGPFFSRGMDRLTDRIEKAGIPADVYEFTICRLIAAKAIREYREDPAPIILIGHSMGGLCALTFSEILEEEHIPVSLVVTVDPAHASPSVPLNVERFINIFLSTSVLGGGDIKPKPGYQGHYASFDLSQHDEVTHINIDKMDQVHGQLVNKILQLSTTPAKAEGDRVPLRYVVPPDTDVELWDSGTPVFTRPGDTLQTIAASYHVPLWALTQINRGADGAPLIPGERIVVPRQLAPVAAVAPVAGQSPSRR